MLPSGAIAYSETNHPVATCRGVVFEYPNSFGISIEGIGTLPRRTWRERDAFTFVLFKKDLKLYKDVRNGNEVVPVATA